MGGWDDELTWKHYHDCSVCGRTAACYNPDCSEDEVCPRCQELDCHKEARELVYNTDPPFWRHHSALLNVVAEEVTRALAARDEKHEGCIEEHDKSFREALDQCLDRAEKAEKERDALRAELAARDAEITARILRIEELEDLLEWRRADIERWIGHAEAASAETRRVRAALAARDAEVVRLQREWDSLNDMRIDEKNRADAAKSECDALRAELGRLAGSAPAPVTRKQLAEMVSLYQWDSANEKAEALGIADAILALYARGPASE